MLFNLDDFSQQSSSFTVKSMFNVSLKQMFNSVATKYDLLNRLLTWTLDETWRENCAQQCASKGVIVDLCCGTGDLALHILKHVALKTCVVGVDFSKAMLTRAADKNCADSAGKRNVSFILADAANLPFRDGVVDCTGISFSFRNLVYRNPQAKSCLKEALRSLRPGGKFICVETSQPRRQLLRILYHLYLMKTVPLVGWLVSQRKEAYRYLAVSAANFPTAEEIADMLLNMGFLEVSFRRLAFGVIALHVGTK